MKTDLAPTFAPVLDALEAQLTAVQAQLALVRTLLVLTVEVTSGPGLATCPHPTITRSMALNREDEYFCGDCGMQLQQKIAP
jgi:hypothetical protein